MAIGARRMRRLALAVAALVVAAGLVLASAVGVGGARARSRASRSSEPIYLNPAYSPAERAADLVSLMTEPEKTSQLLSDDAAPIPRLGVQAYAWANEDLHGVYELNDNVVCGSPNCQTATAEYSGQPPDVHATSFPSNQAATMSWDPSLTYQEGTAIGNEVRGFLDKSLYGTGDNNIGPERDNYGSLSFYAPNVNLMRDPRWGRNNEAFGEDPVLSSAMADAWVDGAQGETMTGSMLTPYLKTIQVAKHFLLNNEEDDRYYGSSNTTDANIRDYYTRQFQSLIEKAHVAGLMSSYNSINETPSPVDIYTLNELAQRTYGFGGYVSSDCQADSTVYQPPPPDSSQDPLAGHDWVPPGWVGIGADGAHPEWLNPKTHQVVDALAGAQAFELRAGTDVDCEGPEANEASIEEAIRMHVMSEGVLDTALLRMFTDRIETGEFDPASKVAWTKITKKAIESPAHTALARRQADEDIVLLKNARVARTRRRLLPVNPRRLKRVVIVGDLAGVVTLGGYSGNPNTQVDAVQGITRAVRAANPKARVTFDACHTSATSSTPAACSASTLAAIKRASLVVVFVGTTTANASEGHDATSIAMPGDYDSLIHQVSAVGNKRMVLAIQAAWPVTLYNVQSHFPAIVFSGYNGEEQGNALADVLFGKQDPSGHLDFTWFKDNAQLPPISNYGLTPAQTGGRGRTYMYFTGKPTYPFGYGLSYTRFRFSKLRIQRTVSANHSLHMSFTVTNVGHVAGQAVPQLYAAPQFHSARLALPIRQLIGFHKTRKLRPRQSQRITVTVPVTTLSRWNESKLREVVPDGRWRIELSRAAGRIAQSRVVRITGRITPRVKYVTVQPDQVEMTKGSTLNLNAVNPWLAPDTNPKYEQHHASADNIIVAVNNDESFVDLARAHVSYHSSNPSVARVSHAGVVKAVSDGVVSISVTVNGVSGSTPIVVN